ncbi:MAG: 30S ribosomal protein S6 [Terriglobia bacterium]
MRIYEVIFIVLPETPEAEVDTLLEQMQAGVAGAGGRVSKVEKWGKRPLAYRVRGQREGFYVFFEVEGGGETLRELERRLKVAEPVFKVLSVRVDLERKRVEKLRHRREHRVARRQRTPGSAAGTAAKAPASAS